MIQTQPSKGVQKNTLKALDVTKNKLGHRYFDNNSRKISEQIFLRMTPGRHFDNCFNGRLLRQLNDLNFKLKYLIKVIPSLLAVRETSSF